MKIGFSLPNIGPIGTAEAVTKVAQRAEALGYSSLWTIERLLYPVKLQTPYPGTPDGSLPEIYRHTLDPLDSLTYVAAQTKKIKLGTSVLDMPPAQGESLLNAVFDHSEKREFVYEHVWRVGDLLLWDNRCSSHARTDFPSSERRLMLRTTVKGTVRPY